MKESCIPYCWKVLLIVSMYENIWERERVDLKNYHPVSLLSIAIKVLEKQVKEKLLRNLGNLAFAMTFSMVTGRPALLLRFWQSWLIELLGILTSSVLFSLYHLIHPRLLIESGRLVFFTNQIFKAYMTNSFISLHHLTVEDFDLF